MYPVILGINYNQRASIKALVKHVQFGLMTNV